MGRTRGTRVALVVLACLAAIGMTIAAPGSGRAPRRHVTRRGPRVLLVGTFHHVRGHYRTIQAAVDAANPGDWILVAPGDYHEQADHRANRGSQPADSPAGVVVTKPDIHIRGLNRNSVIVDGTLPGKGGACSADPARQDFGPKGDDGKPLGRNGILVWKTDGVSIENLTACNFLNGAGSAGNEIWWNGGDGGGKIGEHNIVGTYLNATSTFYKDADTAASYGIFASNTNGGDWDQMYASNMSDSNYYVGACQQVCNQIVNHVWSQYSSQGYSGTNAGGSIVIENSQFDHNKAGFTAGALNNDDWPSPQDGACPDNGKSPITHSYQCFVFMHNFVHDNNNPDVPGAGIASAAPTGTGLLLYGGRDNMVSDNVFSGNGAWGIVFVTYPDTETPPDDVVAAGDQCRGGIDTGSASGGGCVYDDWGNGVLRNTFHGNGSFGNDTNGDIGEITTTAAATNCYHDNVEQGGGQVTTSPSGLEQSKPVCDQHTVPPNGNASMTNQIVCDSQAFAGLIPGTTSTPCPPGANYPQSTGVKMPPMPAGLPSMPNPCRGVPANPWCQPHRARRHRARRHHASRHHASRHSDLR